MSQKKSGGGPEDPVVVVAAFVDSIKARHPFIQVRLLSEQAIANAGSHKELAEEYLGAAHRAVEAIEDKQLQMEAFTAYYRKAQFEICDLENI